MFTSIGVSAALLVIGIVVFVLLCYKGVHTGIAALIGACIVGISTPDGLLSSIFTTFAGGVGTFVVQMFFVFTAAGLLGYVMQETGASESIGKKMTSLLGVDRAPYILAITTTILLIAGIGTYVFIVVVLSVSLMSAANLPRRIGLISCIGIAPAISFCLPLPNVPNSLPTAFLKTSTFSAPVLSICTGIVGIVLFFLYLHYTVKKARKNGEGYDGPEVAKAEEAKDLPPFSTSMAAILVVVILALVFQNVFKIEPTWSTALAQFSGAVFVILTNIKRCKNIGFVKIFSQGSTGMWPFLLLAGCVMGFGLVTQQTASFDWLIQKIFSVQLNPYITACISVAFVAGLCADGISAMMMWLGMFGAQYAAMPDVNPHALHRLLVCTTQTFDSLPHSQSTAVSLSIFGLTHKEAYGGVFVTTVIIPTIFSLFALAGCIIFY
ncbi:MAG TPA: GntP family permease [Clostridiales bacterium]|nr:GntP family permease [Clostridiales bacterium]